MAEIIYAHYEELKKFFIEAELNTCLNANVIPNENKETGFNSYVYEKGVWRYVDMFAGLRRVHGLKTISKQENEVWVPVWHQSYQGAIQKDVPNVDKKIENMYSLLKEARVNVIRESRAYFEFSDYSYRRIQIRNIGTMGFAMPLHRDMKVPSVICEIIQEIAHSFFSGQFEGDVLFALWTISDYDLNTYHASRKSISM